MVVLLTPRLWKKIERFDTGPDYRIPYALSKDYWLYERRLREIADPTKIVVLGDSVVWGEYVLPDGTLSHFLNQEAGQPDRFVNARRERAVPARAGRLGQLLRRAAAPPESHSSLQRPLDDQPQSRPAAPKRKRQFNHSRLVPQFFPRIPCYKADANERLSAVVERNVGFVAWVSHLQNAYFGQKSILSWTLRRRRRRSAALPEHLQESVCANHADRSVRPGTIPSAARRVRGTNRGPKPAAGTTQLRLGRSRDVASMARLPALGENSARTRQRRAGGPRAFQRAHDGRGEPAGVSETPRWRSPPGLRQNQIPHVVAGALPSALYADASHPLTEGYQLLAKRLYQDPAFQRWLRN